MPFHHPILSFLMIASTILCHYSYTATGAIPASRRFMPFGSMAESDVSENFPPFGNNGGQYSYYAANGGQSPNLFLPTRMIAEEGPAGQTVKRALWKVLREPSFEDGEESMAMLKDAREGMERQQRDQPMSGFHAKTDARDMIRALIKLRRY